MKAPADRFSICILGDDPFHGAMEQEIDGKKIDGRGFEVRLVADANTALTCQILFVTASGRNKFRTLLEGPAARGVLTIRRCSGESLPKPRSSISSCKGAIHFEINLEAAEQQQLRISSKLLSLAEIVKELKDLLS